MKAVREYAAGIAAALSMHFSLAFLGRPFAVNDASFVRGVKRVCNLPRDWHRLIDR
jgi:hypothetical protein